jgi:hypothetical protein
VNPKNLNLRVALSTLAVTLFACGSANNPQQTTTVGPAGGTLQTAAATLTIPANALTSSTQVTLRETEPQHQGRSRRVELEPRGLNLAQPARLAIRVDDSNVKVKMHGSDDGLVQVEVEDHNHGSFKTVVTQLGSVEVELEHGLTCSPACTSTQECDDGVCKAHTENANAKSCDPLCDSGQECDDGACKTHSEVEVEHGGTPGVVTCGGCATGLECDNGVCKPHGGA